MNEKAYWATTGIFCLFFCFGGVGHLFRLGPMLEGMTHLGYPLYVMTILGVAKLCGVVVLLMPGQPLLKEWAYAGFTFDLIGATASHAFMGDAIAETAAPVILLGIAAASYYLRPEARRLVPSTV
jgi:hypothetical protein